MRRLLSLLLLTSSMFSLWADEAPKNLERLILAHQKQIPFKRTFTQKKTLKEMSLELMSRGRLEVLGHNKVLWLIEDPAYLKVEIEASTIRIYSDPHAKAQIIEKGMGGASGGMQGMEWMDLLTKAPGEMLSAFEVSEISKNRFRLSEKNKKNSNFEWIEIKFSVAKKTFLEELKIQENKDDQLEFKFNP